MEEHLAMTQDILKLKALLEAGDILTRYPIETLTEDQWQAFDWAERVCYMIEATAPLTAEQFDAWAAQFERRSDNGISEKH